MTKPCRLRVANRRELPGVAGAPAGAAIRVHFSPRNFPKEVLGKADHRRPIRLSNSTVEKPSWLPQSPVARFAWINKLLQEHGQDFRDGRAAHTRHDVILEKTAGTWPSRCFKRSSKDNFYACLAKFSEMTLDDVANFKSYGR